MNDQKSGEDFSTRETVDYRQIGEQSIFIYYDNVEGKTNEQGYYWELETLNQDPGVFSRYKKLLAFVSDSMVGNTFGHDNESPPPSHENIHDSFNLNEDDSFDLICTLFFIQLKQRKHPFHEKQC